MTITRRAKSPGVNSAQARFGRPLIKKLGTAYNIPVYALTAGTNTSAKSMVSSEPMPIRRSVSDNALTNSALFHAVIVSTNLLRNKIMSTNQVQSLEKTIRAAFSQDFNAAAAITAVTKKVIYAAYKTDDMLDVQCLLDNMTRSYRDVLPRFLRHAGFTVDVAPGKPALVQVLDKSKQAKVFAWLATAVVIDPADVVRRAKAYKVSEAPIAVQAQEAIEKLIKRVGANEHNPLAADVAVAINDRLQRPEWVAKLAGLNLTTEEVEMVIEAVIEYRAAEVTPERKAA